MTRLRYITAAATALVAAAAFFSLPVRAGSAVSDTTPPSGAVGGVGSPASGTLKLFLYASDAGLGLANAESTLDGQSAFVRLGAGSCPEHPSPGTTELPPGAECPGSVSAVPLSLDTTAISDGSHQLRVRVADAAANTATLVDQTIVVRNAVSPMGTSASVTIGVANKGEEGHPGKGKGCENGKACEQGKGGEKGKGLALKRKRCRAPRLRMHLAKKPLWHTRPHHVPVLHYRRPYPYKGKLTCLASKGHRRPAPKGTKVGVYYRVWHLSFKRPWGPVKKLNRGAIRTRKGGRLRLKLAFASGRTLIFRYRDPGGKLAKAKLRLAVPPHSRRPPWGPR